MGALARQTVMAKKGATISYSVYLSAGTGNNNGDFEAGIIQFLNWKTMMGTNGSSYIFTRLL